MFKFRQTIVLVFCIFSAIAVTSCSKIEKILGSNTDVFSKITGYQWSINPDKMPDGSVLDIEYKFYFDRMQYYAFNSDSTVDRWGNRTTMRTGKFSIDGDLVVCEFVDEISDRDTITANDGNYNIKIIFKYKDHKLYYYDEQTRTKDNKWISELPLEYRKLFFSEEGLYTNEKYNVASRTEDKYVIEDLYTQPYDTTVDAMAVVRRFNWCCEINYKNGQRNGIYKRYENDELRVLGEYINDEPSGIWFYFTPSGLLEKKQDYSGTPIQ